MRRPPLTRKKIEAIRTCILLAEGEVEDHDGHLAEEEKQVIEASEFVRQLSRWHKWKQEQKGNK